MPGFEMTSGVRQGCPVSPLIFAECMDVLLRTIQAKMGENFAQRVFVDDGGVVLRASSQQLPLLRSILSEFGEVSSVIVNLGKTVGVPFGPERR